MKIHFKSVYGPKDNKNVIEFYSKLEISKYNEYTVLDFEQKQESSAKPIKSKIEYTENHAIIYSGIGTLELELNKDIKNKYIVDNYTMYIYTHLKELNIKEDGVEFHYYVSATEEIDENNEFDLILSFIND